MKCCHKHRIIWQTQDDDDDDDMVTIRVTQWMYSVQKKAHLRGRDKHRSVHMIHEQFGK